MSFSSHSLSHRITLLLVDIILSFSSHSPSQDYSATGRYHFVFLLSLSLTGLLCYWRVSLCLSPLTLPHRITLLLAGITLSFSSHSLSRRITLLLVDITLSFSSHSLSQDYSATGRYHFVFLLSHSLTGLLCYW